MTMNFESTIESLATNQTDETRDTWFETPEDFWAATRGVPFNGGPASLMRYQFTALRNDH